VTGPGPMPAAEVEVDEGLVRCLLQEQHHDLAALPVRLVANGWDNAIYRLGEDLSVRLPRRQLGAELVAHEQRWLPGLARRLPLPVSEPLRTGEPGCGFPWDWTICRWIDGAMAAVAEFDRSLAAADLGAFLAALHVPGPPDAPHNPYRGLPLASRDEATRKRLVQLERLVPPPLKGAWAAALEVPPHSGPPVWLHGDLHPANIVVADGRIAGIIDWGDITAGDPACDFSVGWMLFDADDREIFRAAAGFPDDATWARARGWAITLGLAYVASSADNPIIAAVGHRMLAAVVADS
jgi:aminoglycoside phosphotransferase (APT) family kinase protein